MQWLYAARALLAPVHVPIATIAIVAAVVALDGVRHVPAGAWIVRRSVGRRWRLVRHPATVSGFALVAPFAPWTLGALLRARAPGENGAVAAARRPAAKRPRGRPKGRVSAPRAPTLERHRVLRALEWVDAVQAMAQPATLLLIIVVPIGAASFGLRGFLVGLAGVLFFTGESAAATAAANVDLGATPWRAWRTGLAALSPFSAPYAAGKLLEYAIESGSEARWEVVRQLLDARALADAFRETAYDALHLPVGGADEVAELRREVDPSLLASFLVVPEHCPPGGAYCPRCAAQYEDRVRACAACGVALVSAPQLAPERAPERAPVLIDRG